MTRTAATIVFLCFVTLALVALHFAGIPALPDGRLASEPWRVLAVAPLDGDRFLVSVRYAGGDIRTYRLRIADPGERDELLKAEQGLKKGRALVGKARHSRAGLADDGAMSFEFSDAPEADPKPGHS